MMQGTLWQAYKEHFLLSKSDWIYTVQTVYIFFLHCLKQINYYFVVKKKKKNFWKTLHKNSSFQSVTKVVDLVEVQTQFSWMKGAVQLARVLLKSPFVIVFCLYNCFHPLLAYCCFACYTLMSIKLLKPVRTLNRAFAPDLSKSVSWSLFMEHAARALTCEISNPLDRATVEISHSGRGLSRPQVDFVHCCGLSKLEGMLNIHTHTRTPTTDPISHEHKNNTYFKTSNSFDAFYMSILGVSILHW